MSYEDKYLKYKLKYINLKNYKNYLDTLNKNETNILSHSQFINQTGGRFFGKKKKKTTTPDIAPSEAAKQIAANALQRQAAAQRQQQVANPHAGEVIYDASIKTQTHRKPGDMPTYAQPDRRRRMRSAELADSNYIDPRTIIGQDDPYYLDAMYQSVIDDGRPEPVYADLQPQAAPMPEQRYQPQAAPMRGTSTQRQEPRYAELQPQAAPMPEQRYQPQHEEAYGYNMRNPYGGV